MTNGRGRGPHKSEEQPTEQLTNFLLTKWRRSGGGTASWRLSLLLCVRGMEPQSLRAAALETYAMPSAHPCEDIQKNVRQRTQSAKCLRPQLC